jgi:hypothetical protein
VATGKLLQTFPGGAFQGHKYALAPDGALIAITGQRGGTQLRQVATGKELHHLADDGSDVTALAFSPDGKILAAAYHDQPIKLWDPATGALLWELHRQSNWDSVLVFSPDSKTLASGGTDRAVRLWEVLTGKERWRFEGHNQPCCGAFSRDGRLLATGNDDTTTLVWDLAAPSGTARPLSAHNLDALWADLADPDARKAYQAITTLAGDAARTVPFLKIHLQPVPLDTERRARALVADLASDTFATRTEAMRQLEALGAFAEPALRQALASQPTAELRLRAQQLLEKLDPRRSTSTLRELRALEVLEHIGDGEARSLLQALAESAPGADRGRDAPASRPSSVRA